MATRPTRRVLFLGAGHAHLHSLRRTAEFVRRGCEVVVVAPDDFWYSGLATGVLGDSYPPSLDRVEVAPLVEPGGGRFVRDTVTAIDPVARTVRRAGGPALGYDLLSVNLGSQVPLDRLPGAAGRGYPVKPLTNLLRLREDLETRLPASTAMRPVRVVVVGGGASACEVAANVEHLARSRGGVAHVTLLTAGERLVGQFPRGASAALRRALERRGVQVVLGASAEDVTPEKVRTRSGEEFPYDVLVHATGLRPPALLAASGLPVDADGALRLNAALQSVGDRRVFGGGDCVAVDGHHLPRVGVYAVREAKVLCGNLLAALDGRPLRRYRPQRSYLLVLNLGDGTGLAVRGGWWWHGRLAFRLKDWLDRRFLDEYRVGGHDGCPLTARSV